VLSRPSRACYVFREEVGVRGDFVGVTQWQVEPERLT
jgi:hypothetical protein